MFEMKQSYDNKMTYVGIADKLNNMGYRTKKGLEFKHSAIQNILGNEETYRGHYRYGVRNYTENQHEAILDPGERLHGMNGGE